MIDTLDIYIKKHIFLLIWNNNSNKPKTLISDYNKLGNKWESNQLTKGGFVFCKHENIQILTKF